MAQESHGEILFTTLAPRINVFSNLQRDTYRYAGLDLLMNQRSGKDTTHLTVKAHGLSSLIMDVNLDGATMQDLAHINLLVAKLHGPSIGLSVLGIITITKEMILTLAGVFMTYLFLLIQFKI